MKKVTKEPKFLCFYVATCGHLCVWAHSKSIVVTLGSFECCRCCPEGRVSKELCGGQK